MTAFITPRRLRLTLTAALAAGFASLQPLFMLPAAQAGPALYVTSFPLRASQTACLSRVRELLMQVGMEDGDIRQSNTKDSNGRSVPNGWWGEHPEQDITAQFECDGTNRMGALAVAGSDNDAVYALYERLWDLLMSD